MGNGTKVGLVVVLVLGVVVIATLLDRDVDQAPDGREQARLDLDADSRTQHFPADPANIPPETGDGGRRMDSPLDDEPIGDDPSRDPWVPADPGRDREGARPMVDRDALGSEAYASEFRPRDLSEEPEFRFDGNSPTISRTDLKNIRQASGDPSEAGLTGRLRPEDPPRRTREETRRETPASTTRGDFPKTHEVVSGDRLWNIAARYYGKGHLYKHIVSANSSLDSADDIRPGMKLTIPAPPETRPPTPRISGDPGRTHTIETGDTFSGLALRYLGTSSRYQEIADLNPDVEPTRMKVGTVIKIPEK